MAQKLDADLNIIQNSGIEIQIDPLTKDLNIIQALDDEPNDVGGLSAAELKAKFDEAGNVIKDYINDSLIPQVLGDGLTEADRQKHEAQRQANETRRQENETRRQENEGAREEAEGARNVWEDYDPAKAYVPGNKVYYLGSSYVNKAACQGVLPTVAASWQMIARKGADGDGGLSPEEGDLRYLQLSGGAMTGPLTVLEPEGPDSPATPRYLRPESISVTRLPDKTGYRLGEGFDPSGMVVSAQYENGEAVKVTGYAVEPGAFRRDTEKISILYTENRAEKAAELTVYGTREVYPFAEKPLPLYQHWGTPVYGGGVWVFPPASSSNRAAFSEDGGETLYLATLPDSNTWLTPVYGDGVWLMLQNASSNTAARSEDGGKTWTKATLPVNQGWGTPVYGDGVWVLPPYDSTSSATAAYSEDGGKTWTKAALPVTQAWNTPVYGNGVWALTPYASSNKAAYSEDGGKTWTLTTLPVNQNWRPPVYGDGVLVMISYGTSNAAARSADGGKTWTRRTLPASDSWLSPAYGGGVWIVPASSGNNISRSEDGGITWTEVTLSSNMSKLGAVYGGGVWLIAPSGNSEKIPYSEDGGETWSEGTLPSFQEWTFPIYADGLWFASPYLHGDVLYIAAYSEDGGKTWIEVRLPRAAYWGNPVYADDSWMMVAGDAEAQQSFLALSGIKRFFSLLPEQEYPADLPLSLEERVSALEAENAALAAAVERGLAL